MPHEAHRGKNEEHIDTELADEFADEVTQVYVQTVKYSRQNSTLALIGHTPGAGELPMNTRPAHETEQHRHGCEHRKKGGDAHQAGSALLERLECTDAGGYEY